MALQTSGSISFSDLKNEFNGVNPVVLSDYYRGGPYVPDRIVQPASGYYSGNDNYCITLLDTMYRWYWAGNEFYSGTGTASGSSLTYGGYTYYRGDVYKTVDQGKAGIEYYYEIRRVGPYINTDVPTSGTIKLSDFYGAKRA